MATSRALSLQDASSIQLLLLADTAFANTGKKCMAPKGFSLSILQFKIKPYQTQTRERQRETERKRHAHTSGPSLLQECWRSSISGMCAGVSRVYERRAGETS